ncbi:P-loop containing nucleoside triphosphate hydrolase protein, partial [Stachybotrys elegans]
IVPYPSNPDFVGRSKILQQLKDNLGHTQETSGTSQPRVSVFGLGGIGKTQIVLAYVYWLQEMYPSIAILWVHASNAERFRQSFKAIAEEYQIPGHDDAKVDTLAIVKAWLEKRDGRRWLMVVDNADDMQLFFPPPTRSTLSTAEPNDGKSFSEHLPECAHGALLVTTRNKQLGIKLAKGQCVIGVDRMDEDESEHLLRAKHIHATSPELLTLSARLEHLPLALVQAATYIQEMSITVAKYLELLGETDQHTVHLLSKEFETVGRDTKAPRAVAQTWILSFQQIEQQQALASNLLSFMSFFDRQEIPATFLSHYTKQNTSEEAIGDLVLTEALGILKAFSFVTEDNDGNYDMHRLVQLVTRKWLASCGTVDRFGKEALLTLSHLYPFGKYETRTICSAYQSHASAVLQSCKIDSKDKDAANAKAGLLHCMAGYLNFEGKWGDAEALCAEATRIRRKLFGEDHDYTLASMSNLASILRRQGRWEEAEKLEMQVMETRKIKFGIDHPDTLRSMSNLASTFWEQSRWDKAEKLDMQVMETRKIKLGVDHPDTLISMHNLASTLSDQGRLEEAEKLEVQIMESYKMRLGADHPDTLTIMDNLAWTWYGMEKKSEAMDLMRLCIRLRQAKLGLDHPHTQASMFALDRWESKG